jgi:hypothetical protein
MSSLNMGLLILACVFGGALAGMLLRAALPEHHLSKESQDVVKLGAGLIGTMAALVLGLLVGSAKSSYDKQSDEITDMSANVLLLDRVLAHYGPETQDARERLRLTVSSLIERIWSGDPSASAQSAPTTTSGEELYDVILQLTPTNDLQRRLQSEAEAACTQFGHERLLLYQQGGSSLSMPMLIVLVFWLSVIFVSFGLFAPRNVTVITTLFVCALSVSGAMYLILEMTRPFAGLIKISDAPVRNALMLLGK